MIVKFLKIVSINVVIFIFVLASLLVIGGYGFYYFVILSSYNKIEIGMNEKQVNAIFIESAMPLADEQYEQPGFCGTPQIWYGDCEAAKKSGATYFLTYKVFFDTYAIIGLKDEKVIYKGVGET